jgi:hypothetical protein
MDKPRNKESSARTFTPMNIFDIDKLKQELEFFKKQAEILKVANERLRRAVAILISIIIFIIAILCMKMLR